MRILAFVALLCAIPSLASAKPCVFPVPGYVIQATPVYANPLDWVVGNDSSHGPRETFAKGGVMVEGVLLPETYTKQYAAEIKAAKIIDRYSIRYFKVKDDAGTWWIPDDEVYIPAFGGYMTTGPRRCTFSIP